MNDDYQRYVRLSWYILECKYVYYCSPPGLSCPPDEIYDQYENEYKELAEKLNQPKSATEMVGFDETRPCCRLVKERLKRGVKILDL